MAFLGRGGVLALCAVAFLAAASLAILTRNLSHHPPTYDELLHILSARGVVETGKPVIAQGLYDRAELFTRAAVAFRHLTSDELIAARLPALLAALALTALVAGWTASQAGWFAGLVAGMLMATHAWTINLAVFARFYTFHALAFFVLFIGLYSALSPAKSLAKRAAHGILGLIVLALSLHLQISTLIGVGAMVVGLLVGLAVERADDARRLWQRYSIQLIMLAVAAAAASALVLRYLNFLGDFTTSPLWSQSAADRFGFYNIALANGQPFFWPLLPFAALVVCWVKPRLGWVLLTTLAVAWLVHSAAAPKATRYFYYMLPFVCILLGCGLSYALALLRDGMSREWPSLKRLVPVVVLVLLGISVATSQEGYRTARLLVGADSYQKVLTYGDETDWSSARPIVAAALRDGATLITSNSMKSLYYFGHYDYELNASIVADTRTKQEFGVDERTGGTAFSTPRSLARVLADHPRALLVIEKKKLGVRSGVPQETVEAIEVACTVVAVPPDSGVAVWRCPQ